MAGFHNPFSQKPDYASGLSNLASQVMQFLALSKMDGGGGGSFNKRMALPGAQTPQIPQMPQMGPQMGMQGGMMAPGKGPASAPVQQQAPKSAPMGD
ncbi:hypothetical protein LCGC14_2568010, partial [marine sediment metagenome]